MSISGFSVLSIRYVAQGLRGCNITADTVYKCRTSFMEQSLL